MTSDIVDQLKGRGHEVLVITSRHQRERITTLENGIRRVFHLQSPDRDFYHPHYVLADRWHEYENLHFMKQAITEFLPDCIFIHGLWNMSRKIALDAEKLYPNRVVYYMASHWPTEMDAHTSYWRAPTRRTWMRLPKKVASIFVRNVLLSDSTSRRPEFSHVLCVSKYIQDCMIDQVGVPIQQTKVVHNGIDLKAFPPKAKKRVDGNQLKLLYAGGFWEHKGVISALDAIDHLINSLSIRNVHLSLVGAGHPEYVAHMKRRIRETHIESYVSFRDRVPRDQMPNLLKSYDILLFPSTGPEPLPRIVQEAMACGLLVIGSNAGGTPEILHDGVNGLSFDAGDSKMLAEKIASVASDPHLCERLALAARRTVEEQFSIEIMVNKIEEYFASL